MSATHETRGHDARAARPVLWNWANRYTPEEKAEAARLAKLHGWKHAALMLGRPVESLRKVVGSVDRREVRRFWMAKKKAELVAMLEAKPVVAGLGEKLGTTDAAVHVAITRFNLRHLVKPTALPVDVEVARQMRRDGHTYAEIGRRFGVGTARAYYVVNGKPSA